MGIVHGDYRLDNVLTDDHDRLAAVIDWEMATLGDPLTDLAYLVVCQRLGAGPCGAAVASASSAPGFLTEDEIIQRYAGRSQRDLSRFGFYLGLARTSSPRSSRAFTTATSTARPSARASRTSARRSRP